MPNIASKIRLYPTEIQEKKIKSSVGCSRFLYNLMLDERIKVYEELKSDKERLYSYKYKTEKQYKEEYPFLSDASSRALQQSRIDLESAFKNFYTGLKKNKKVGFPKFKKKSKVKWSYREPQVNGNAIEIKNNKIKLNKLGWVKFRGLNSSIADKIKSVTIEIGRDGKYYASVLYEADEVRKKQRIGSNIVGVDLGLKEFITVSNGEMIKGIDLKPLDRKIDQANRHLSRKKYGSNRYGNQRIKLNRLYTKRNNIQNHFFWSLANKLCRENQSIAIENLNVSGMVRNKKLSRSIHKISWSNFVTKLKQKSIEYGTNIYEAEMFFPSSKLCSSCGTLKEDIKLSDRTYTCDCGYTQDRDVNAAINLRNKFMSVEYTDYRRGEIVRPVRIVYDPKGSFYETSTEIKEVCV
jgi:putative transposase